MLPRAQGQQPTRSPKRAFGIRRRRPAHDGPEIVATCFLPRVSLSRTRSARALRTCTHLEHIPGLSRIPGWEWQNWHEASGKVAATAIWITIILVATQRKHHDPFAGMGISVTAAKPCMRLGTAYVAPPLPPTTGFVTIKDFPPVPGFWEYDLPAALDPVRH